MQAAKIPAVEPGAVGKAGLRAYANPMPIAPLHLGPHHLQLDPAGALVWPAEKLLAVADLHLEKGSASAKTSYPVPPFDSRDTLARLALLLRRYQPQTLVLLGDSFHDRTAAGRLAADDAQTLTALCQGRRVIWVCGNHDPLKPDHFPGEAAADFAHGGLMFRHQAQQPHPARGSAPEISGHFHPKSRVPTRAGMISRPCFVASAARLLLPAFGAYTGGLDIGDPAITALFPRGGRAFLLGRDRLYSFPLAQAAVAFRQDNVTQQPGPVLQHG